jgi:hypothetical protein
MAVMVKETDLNRIDVPEDYEVLDATALGRRLGFKRDTYPPSCPLFADARRIRGVLRSSQPPGHPTTARPPREVAGAPGTSCGTCPQRAAPPVKARPDGRRPSFRFLTPVVGNLPPHNGQASLGKETTADVPPHAQALLL